MKPYAADQSVSVPMTSSDRKREREQSNFSGRSP